MKDNKTDEKTYVVYCHTTPDGMQYIGTTCNVKNRWIPALYKKNDTPFKDAIERFGWENITHEVIASGLTREAALKLEDSLIKEGLKAGSCLNVRRSGHRTQTDEYKKEQNVRKSNWRKTHPEEHRAYQREWMRKKRKRKKDNGDSK